jgi:3-hydroxybutyryl-CoA dehydrogenase
MTEKHRAEQAKHMQKEALSAMNNPLERVAVIGTGILGAQIALLAAEAGYEVKTYDPRPGALMETIGKLREDIRGKGISPYIPWENWDGLTEAVFQTTDIRIAVIDADLVIEAVPEVIDMKRKVWEAMGRFAPPRAIFATNSSSMPVSRMEDAGGRPERSLNIHFYFPLQGVYHVDVMGGTRTAAEILDIGKRWVRSIRCLPLTVKKELLGFCFNRIWRSIKREALFMWGNDYVDYRDVDRGWMVFTNMKEGPFGIMDKVGLDVVWDIEMVYYDHSKDPKDKPPQALREKIDRGELGVKSGRGFYTYPHPEFLNPGFLKG